MHLQGHLYTSSHHNQTKPPLNFALVCVPRHSAHPTTDAHFFPYFPPRQVPVFAMFDIYWQGLLLPLAYLGVLVGTFVTFSRVYRRRKAGMF